MHEESSPRELRSFGFIVGGIFCAIGLLPLVFRTMGPRWWAFVIAGLLVIPALLFPRVLGPVHRVWMAIGHALGWINTRIILGALFYSMFSFVGLLLRIIGKDPLHRKFEREADTYRVMRQLRPASHMEHQF